MVSFVKRNTVCLVAACLLVALIANVYMVLFSGNDRDLSKLLWSFVKTEYKHEHRIRRPGDGDSIKRMQELEGEVSDIRQSVSDLWQSITELKAHETLPRRDVEQELEPLIPTPVDEEEHNLDQPNLKTSNAMYQDSRAFQSSSILLTPAPAPQTFSCPAPELLASTASQSIISESELSAAQCGTPVSRGFLFHTLKLALIGEGAGLTKAQAGEVAHASIHACPVSVNHDIMNDCRRLTLWGRLKGREYIFNVNVTAQHSSSSCLWKVAYNVPYELKVNDEQTYELQLVNTWYGGSTGPNTASCNEAVDANWLPPEGLSDMSSLEIAYRNGPKYLGSNAMGCCDRCQQYEECKYWSMIRPVRGVGPIAACHLYRDAGVLNYTKAGKIGVAGPNGYVRSGTRKVENLALYLGGLNTIHGWNVRDDSLCRSQANILGSPFPVEVVHESAQVARAPSPTKNHCKSAAGGGDNGSGVWHRLSVADFARCRIRAKDEVSQNVAKAAAAAAKVLEDVRFDLNHQEEPGFCDVDRAGPGDGNPAGIMEATEVVDAYGSKGNTPRRLVWMPDRCELRYRRSSEMRSCLTDRGLRTLIFSGDSVMAKHALVMIDSLSGGTAAMDASQGEASRHVRRVDLIDNNATSGLSVAYGSFFSTTAAKDLVKQVHSLPQPSVLVANFAAQHMERREVGGANVTAWAEKFALDWSAATAKTPLHPGTRLFVASPVALHAFREPYCTDDRAAEFWRAMLPPLTAIGFEPFDLYEMAASRPESSYDGMHYWAPVVASMNQMLVAAICNS